MRERKYVHGKNGVKSYSHLFLVNFSWCVGRVNAKIKHILWSWNAAADVKPYFQLHSNFLWKVFISVCYTYTYYVYVHIWNIVYVWITFGKCNVYASGKTNFPNLLHNSRSIGVWIVSEHYVLLNSAFISEDFIVIEFK